MLFPLTKPGCIGSQQQLCQRILLAADLICSHARYKSSIGVKELMHFFNATHTSINAIDKAEAECSSPHSITPKTPVRSVGSGQARAKRGHGRPSMKNNSKHATRQALRFSCRKRARAVPTPAPDVASKRAQTTSAPDVASKHAQTSSASDVASKHAQTTSASAAQSASATDTAASADLGSKRLKASPLADADSTPAEASACADAADDSRPAEGSACADAANDSRPADGSASADAANDSTATLMADADSNEAQTVAMPSAANAQCDTEAAARCTPETEGSSGVVSSTDVVHSVPDARYCLKQLLIEYQLAAETRNGADKITIVPADTCCQASGHNKVRIGVTISFYICLV